MSDQNQYITEIADEAANNIIQRLRTTPDLDWEAAVFALGVAARAVAKGAQILTEMQYGKEEGRGVVETARNQLNKGFGDPVIDQVEIITMRNVH